MQLPLKLPQAKVPPKPDVLPNKQGNVVSYPSGILEYFVQGALPSVRPSTQPAEAALSSGSFLC